MQLSEMHGMGRVKSITVVLGRILAHSKLNITNDIKTEEA